MIDLSPDDFKAILAEAQLAPSVHNVQPTRWRLRKGGIDVLGDTKRSIPIADPSGRDWRISHGAALEGFDLALRARGLCLADIVIATTTSPPTASGLVHMAGATIATCRPTDVRDGIRARVSWRGGFVQIGSADATSLDGLAARHEDMIIIRRRSDIQSIAVWGDLAGLHFLRDDAHRRELLHWLRLKPRHPDYERDGLNARAMSLNAFEASGAALVLGPMFRLLDGVGAAAPMMSEAGKTRSAAAIVLLHRPVGEDALQSGRAFYRAWLDIERAGFKGCPISVLADWPQSNTELCRTCGVPDGRNLVSVFRIGRPRGAPSLVRARLPIDEIIVT